MTCRLWWYGRNRNRKSNSSMADVLGKWNGMSSQSHMPHCRVLPSAKFSVMSSQSHVPPCRVLPPGESWTEANPSKKHNFGQLLTMWKTSLFHCKISWPHWIDSGRLFTNAGHTYNTTAVSMTGSVPYRPQTIISHDHIGHTKRPYRPKGIIISATKMYCYLAPTFISCQSRLETSYTIPSRISGE